MDNFVIKISVENLLPKAREYMSKMCGFNRANDRAKKALERANKIQEEFFGDASVSVLMSEMSGNAIEENSIKIGNKALKCSVLDRLKGSKIEKIRIFMLRSPMPDLSKLPISQMYLADTWQTAFVDSARDYLRENFQKESENLFVTDAIGPGLYGMDAYSLSSFFEVLDGEKVGIKLESYGMMHPVKSIAGFFLFVDNEVALPPLNCRECIGNKSGCIHCKNYRISQ